MSEAAPTPQSPPPEGTDETDGALTVAELLEAWQLLTPQDRLAGFRLLEKPDAEELFLGLSPSDQWLLVQTMPAADRRGWVRFLAPDDAADLIQEAEPADREPILAMLDDATRKEVTALLAYKEDVAGGLMSPRFARVRPDMQVDEAIRYLRLQARTLETIYYVYVLDAQQRLMGCCSFRELFAAAPERPIRDVMHTDLVTVLDTLDQESVSKLVKQHGFVAVPVVDAQGTMKGIVTVDDIVEVVDEEATEDIQKLGGMSALQEPYLQTDFWTMIRKRGGWLAALFVGEMLTTTAMAHFEEDIARAVVLAMFIPLIISSGGNSGSQATTLVIRAMALDEVRLRDWGRVAWREAASGMVLGALLGTIGLLRIALWQKATGDYGPHWAGVAATVGISLVGVTLFGTLSGSLLPFALRRVGLDPASASAPFVATLVDVSGILIYFGTASVLLKGTLLP